MKHFGLFLLIVGFLNCGINNYNPDAGTDTENDTNNSESNKFILVFSGNSQSEIDPCGCPVVPRGGIARRAKAISILRDNITDPIFVVDTGGSIGDTTLENKVKTQILIEAMSYMKYDVVNISYKDLLFSYKWFSEQTEINKVPVISINLMNEDSSNLVEPMKILEFKNHKIAFLGVTYTDDVDSITWPNKGPFAIPVKMEDPVEYVEDALKELANDKLPVFTILLADVTEDALNRLAKISPSPDLIVIAGPSDNLIEASVLENSIVFNTGKGGKFLGVAEISFDNNGNFDNLSVRSIDLNEDISDEEQMAALAASYNTRLEEAQNQLINAAFPQKETENNATYEGFLNCTECHQTQTDLWFTTPHSQAYYHLLLANQDFNPQCLPCHTTGFGYKTGYTYFEDTSNLSAVQCEECHGPRGNGAEKLPDYGTVSSDRCVKCHVSLYIPLLYH